MFVDISLAAAVGTTETRGDNLNIITGEWSPHVSAFNSWPGATRNDAYGIGTEILAIALRQCGLAAEFRFRPWKKVLDAADAQAGLAFPFRYSQKRAERFEFSEPLMVSLEYLFFNPIKAPELAHARKIEALTGARLVFVSGYEYAPTFAALRGAEVMEANDEMEAFQWVISGKADGVIADWRVGNFLLKTFFPDKGRLIEVNRRISAETTLSVLLSKRLVGDRGDVLVCLNEKLAYLKDNAAQKRLAAQLQLDDELEFDVILDGPSDFPVAVGTETANGKEGFLIPRGSRALVLSWDDAFTRKQDVGDRHLMYEKTAVKLLDGPLRGRVLWVPNLFLRY